MRKPACGVSDQVLHKPCCTTTEDSYKLEISNLGSIFVAKIKALISCAAFFFAYAKCRFFSWRSLIEFQRNLNWKYKKNDEFTVL